MDRKFDQLIPFQQTLRSPYATYEAQMDRLLEAILTRLDVRPDRLPQLGRRVSRAVRAANKRALDLAIAVPALIFLTPLLIVVALLVRTKLGAPVLFRQERPGLHGKPFTLYKFRTMTDERDVDGELLPNERRMTRFGKLLRSTSLDELPELINVLRGEMSLVGSRPLLMDYLSLYTPEQMRRHEVKPGITGWAQVNGRNNLSWEEKFALDVWYVEHYNVWLDIKILFTTAQKVVKREGISPEGQVTMPRFTGSVHASESALS